MSKPMDAAEHRRLRELLGSYAFGALPRTATASVRAHLDGCAECRAQLAEIAPLVDDLRGADPERVSTVATPPADLGARIRSAVASERRHQHRRGRGRRLLAAAAAAAALLVVGAVGVAIGERRGEGPPVPLEAVSVRSDVPGVSADAGVVPHTWGVEIKLQATGFRAGESYVVTVRTEDGRERPAGAFVGTGERVLTCNLNSDVLRGDAAGFTVVDADGETVLSAELPNA
jgi:anti-sigma factor ChrR (cupin superfamily)